MARGSTIRNFLNQRQNSLKKTLHVRRLLLSHHLRGVLSNEERTQIENERSEDHKCELFVNTLLSKDDRVVEKFMRALEDKQPQLDVVLEWKQICKSETEGQYDVTKCSREPTESEDDSLVMEKTFYPAIGGSEGFGDSCKLNDFDVSKPGPLTTDGLDYKNIADGGASSLGAGVGCDDIATKVIYHLSRHVQLSLKDRSEFVSRINRALSEQDLMRDTNQKLVDILVRLVRQQRLSPVMLQRALEDMGLAEVATDLISQTVHDKYLHELPVDAWAKLTQELSVNTHSLQGHNCGRLVEALGLKDKVNVTFVTQQCKCPAEEILNIWKQKRKATVSNLYHILLNMEAFTAANILEPYLPVISEMSEGKVMDRSLSMCSSISDNEIVDKSLNL